MAKSDKKKTIALARKPLGKPKLGKPKAQKPKIQKPKIQKPKGRSVRARAAAASIGAGAGVLDRLYGVIETRRDADPTISHSARLLSRGPAKVAQKFGEEAVECLIEAVAGNHDAVVAESADVLYHLLVLWVSSGVSPIDVWAELERREGISGIEEKAARAKAVAVSRSPLTTKIP
jgi:phosphoribosyl-ATP pyrophosphohydrolase